MAIQFCPWTSLELARGLLPAGTHVELPEWTLHRAKALDLHTVAVGVRRDTESPPMMLKVNVHALREALVPLAHSTREQGV